MTITQLKYVLSVAEYQNFTVAAQHSFVTQPTLSMQIQKLEDEFTVSTYFTQVPSTKKHIKTNTHNLNPYTITPKSYTII